MSSKVDAAKKTLLENLPKVLAGYGKTPGYDAVFVLLDTDDRNVAQFRQELESMVQKCDQPPKTVFGLATEEIEAWYLGDRDALTAAYPKANKKVLNRYIQDGVCGTWELLADALVNGGAAAVKAEGWRRAGELKHEWAEKIGALMNIHSNKSPSFFATHAGVVALVS